MNAVIDHTRAPSAEGRARLLAHPLEPLFLADWDRALFLHLEADPAALAPHVPFDLDLFGGTRAFVSFVAFTMRGLRLRRGGPWLRWVTWPIATHRFLNLRTYVRCGDEPGIFFLDEWLDNRIAVHLGPPLFGLPYRLGGIDYAHDTETGALAGRVEGRRGCLAYCGRTAPGQPAVPCAAGGLDEFLVERYTAFTRHRFFRGYFRIWHQPWPQVPARMELLDRSLLAEATGGSDWADGATFAGAHFSPGLNDVWMGRPHRLPAAL
jgi:uncharacterized protein YqjF (DUF2071 family)